MYSARTRNLSLKNVHSSGSRWDLDPSQKLKVPKVLPTIAENREQSRMQAKELSLNINKFQNNLHKGSSDGSQEELIRNAFYVIKSFGEVDNNFKPLFLDIQARVKEYLFISDPQLCKSYKIREGCSFKKAISKVDKVNAEIISQKNKQIMELQEKLSGIEQRYREQLDEGEQEIRFLKLQVERYKKMSNTEYVKSLQDKVEELKEIVSEQESNYREIVKKNEELSDEKVKINEELMEEQFRTSNLEAKIYDLSIFREKSEIYLLKIRDRFEELGARMESMKAIIKKVQAENETLVSERIKLVNRAAVTFDDLTPRPKYSSYFGVNPEKNLLPTRQIFEIMINQLPGSKQQFCDKYFLSAKNRKLMECQAIRLKTFEDLNRVQSEISSLM